eukprot:5115330-Prymnesium_polylepis.1
MQGPAGRDVEGVVERNVREEATVVAVVSSQPARVATEVAAPAGVVIAKMAVGMVAAVKTGRVPQAMGTSVLPCMQSRKGAVASCASNHPALAKSQPNKIITRHERTSAVLSSVI